MKQISSKKNVPLGIRKFGVPADLAALDATRAV
jgi:hypothetical protein